MADTKILEAKINQTLVLKKIRQKPGISRIEIARELGLNRSTITHIVSDLLQRKLLEEGEALRGTLSQGGRTPIGLALHTKNSLIMGIEWQADYVRTVITDVMGEILSEETRSLKSKDTRDFYRVVKDIINKSQTVFKTPVKALSVGIPGRVNPFEGKVLHSLAFGFDDFSLVAEMSNEFALPVLIENDANCFAWGELQKNNRNTGNLLCLMLEFHFRGEGKDEGVFDDQEIGIGIVQNGKIYYGAQYSAGELDRELVQTALKKEHLDQVRRTGEVPQEAEGLVGDYVYKLFDALKPIVSVLDPGTVILGGDFLLLRDYIDTALKTVYGGGQDFLGRSEIVWKYSEMGEFEVAFGAACHLLESLFTIPSYEMGNHERIISWEQVLN
jgi:predicted NBD/HSP70 family sugar kinase